jgi:hypothetical protein
MLYWVLLYMEIFGLLRCYAAQIGS